MEPAVGPDHSRLELERTGRTWSRLLLRAVESPAEWAELLRGIAEAFQARAAILSSTPIGTGAPVLTLVLGYPSAPLRRAGKEQWSRQGPWLRELVARLHQPGDYCLSQELADQPRGIQHGLFYAVHVEPDRLVLLSLFRPQEAAPFQREQAAPLLEVLPDLAAALRLQQKAGRIEASASALAEAAECLPQGYLQLSRDLKVVLASQRARQTLDGRYGLRLAGNRIVARDAALDAQVLAFLQRAQSARVQRGLPEGLRLRSPAGTGDLWLIPRRLAAAAAATCPNAPRLALWLIAPRQPWKASPETLIALFKLTRGEARSACLMAEGLSVADAARQLGVTPNTVKSHLRQVYGKLGIKRQSELVILLLRTAGL